MADTLVSPESAATTTTTTTTSDVSRDELLGKITVQLEYYFSDTNLRKDRYLRQRISTNENGLVDIADLLTFNRLKTLSTDPADIAEAARRSNLLEVNEKNDAVRRKAKLPGKEQPVDVSVAVSGLPLNSTEEEILEAFKTINGVEPQFIFLRKDKKHVFHGEAFVELSNAEQVGIAVEHASELRFRKTEILPEVKITPMADFMAQYKKSDMLKAPQEKSKADSALTGDKGAVTEEKERPIDIEVGSLLKFEGVSDDCTREIIKSAINARVTFIDYQKGETTGIVRFASAADCQSGIECLKPKDGVTPAFKFASYKVLDESETNDYKNIIEERRRERFSRIEQQKNTKGPNRGGRGGGRGGSRHGGNRGGRDHRRGGGGSQDRGHDGTQGNKRQKQSSDMGA